MTIQALQNLIPQSIQIEYKSFVANDHVQKTLLVASDAMKKCIQATSNLLPKEITKDISVDSIVEKIKTCVCNISGAQYCLLFGLTWVSRQIPLVRRISFVFEAAMLVSVLHVFKRMDENNAKSAEENRKFRESNAIASELTLRDKQTIADLKKIIEDNNQFVENNKRAEQLTSQDQKLIASTIEITKELKAQQPSNTDHADRYTLLVERKLDLWTEKVALQQRSKKINKVATATLNPSQQPQSTTSLTAAQEPELSSNRAEESGVNQPLTTNLGSNSSDSVNLLVNNQPLTLHTLNEALEVWKNDPNVTGNKLEASQRIRQAFQNKSIDLDLSRLQLNNLPNIIGQLTEIQTLYLWSNQLQALPSEIGHLTQLQTLDLSNNKLKELPAGIVNLTQLQSLDLQNNQLQALAAAIGQFTQLKKLDLSFNQLQALPSEIGHLTQIQEFIFGQNQNLAELPLSLGELSQLSFIDIEGTQISPEVRDSILAHCQAKKKE